GMDPNQAMQAVEDHLRAHNIHNAQLHVRPGEAGKPFVGDSQAVSSTMMKQALFDAWGAPAVETGLGGSIPFVADLVETFPQAEILLTGIEDPDTKAHSPNESLDLSVLRHAIEAQVLLLARMALDQVK